MGSAVSCIQPVQVDDCIGTVNRPGAHGRGTHIEPGLLDNRAMQG